MATEPDRAHAYLTLRPKAHYCGLASRVPPDGVGSLAPLQRSAITKDAEYLGRNDPRVSGIPHSLAESLQDVARDEMLLPGEVYKKCILW